MIRCASYNDEQLPKIDKRQNKLAISTPNVLTQHVLSRKNRQRHRERFGIQTNMVLRERAISYTFSDMCFAAILHAVQLMTCEKLSMLIPNKQCIRTQISSPKCRTPTCLTMSYAVHPQRKHLHNRYHCSGRAIKMSWQSITRLHKKHLVNYLEMLYDITKNNTNKQTHHLCIPMCIKTLCFHKNANLRKCLKCPNTNLKINVLIGMLVSVTVWEYMPDPHVLYTSTQYIFQVALLTTFRYQSQ